MAAGTPLGRWRSGPAIGIDLGTTYSCVAVSERGNVTIIRNDVGEWTTPSCVAFSDFSDTNSSFLSTKVGVAAKFAWDVNPENVIYDVKRLIGRKFNDTSVQKDIKLWPFKVIGEDNSPRILVNGSSFHPEQISAKVLSYLKKLAEEHLGVPVTDAVITVPAYFNDGQRQATKDAGDIAGLNVLRIINEPTAAAIAFNHQLQQQSISSAAVNFSNPRTVLIFDLGGGTLDLALLTMAGENIVVKAVDGDTHLGGQDFDNRLVDYCIQEFKKKHNIDLSQPQANAADEKLNVGKRLRRLKNECEVKKINLSTTKHVILTVEVICKDLDLNMRIKRETFESINKPLFDKCIAYVDNILRESNTRKEDIDDYILVGGSCRIPKIQELLKNYFGGKAPCITLRQDEAVAYGAAVVASSISSPSTQDIDKTMKSCSSQSQPRIKFVDVIPLNIGIQTYGDKSNDFYTVINKNTAVPHTTKRRLKTVFPNQPSVKVTVYEGLGLAIEDNHLLGEFLLHLPSSCPQGEPVDVQIEVDKEGILQVFGEVRVNRNKFVTTVTSLKGRLKNKKMYVEQMEIQEMFSEATSLQSLGHVERIRYKVRSSTLGIMYNVIDPLEKFIKQSDCVQKLQDAITRSESTNDSHQHPSALSTACILYGQCGSGKTEIVRKYIQQHRNIYENVVWLDALNQSTAEKSLRGLAKDLRIPANDICITSNGYKTFLHAIYLDLCKRRSLVVLDNADCDSKGGNEYSVWSLIPDALSNTCISLTIIIIARNQIFDKRAICPSIWTDQDAVNFFKEELSLYKEMALKLPKELIFLPSFLAQAVCLIRNNCYVGVTITLEDALTKFFNEYSKFFIATSSSKPATKTEEDHSVNTVWKMTLNRVQNTDNGNLAIEILNFLVYLNYGHIPRQLIPELFHEELEGNRDQALALLIRYNLCVDYGNYLGVPRIARDFVAEELRATDQETRVFEALMIVFSKLLATTYDNYDLYTNVLYNAQYLVMEHLKDRFGNIPYGRFARTVALGIQRIEPTSSLKTLKMLNDAENHYGSVSAQHSMNIGNGLASILNLSNLSQESLLVIDGMLLRYAEKPGLDPNLVVECKLLQAEALDLMGRTLDAFSLYKNILNGSSRVLSIRELHDSVNMSVEPNRLIQTYRQILELQNRTFRNQHHPIILRMKKRLASCLCSSERHGLAITFYTEVLDAQDTFTNYYLPDILETMQNLAEALNAHTYHVEALIVFNRILKHQESILNPENPIVLHARKNIAMTLIYQKQFEEAIQIYKQVLELEEKDLGSEHPVVLVTKRHLAETLVSSGKVADGFTMLLDVVNVEENILGKDHPNVLITKKCIEHAIRKN